MKSIKRESAGLLMALSAIVIWATSAACVVWLGRRMGAWQYLALGNLVGCLAQVVFYRMMGRSPFSLFVLPWRLWLMAFLGFLLYSVVYNCGLIAAKTDAHAIVVSLMNYLWPVLMVLFSVFLVPGVRMNLRLGLALALSIGGLLLATGPEMARAKVDGAVLPFVLGGIAGISWALYSAFIVRWRDWCRNYATAPVGFLMASAAGGIGCIVTGEWRPVDAQTWLVILYIGILPNAAGYMLWELALHRAPATTLGLVGSAMPVLSTLCMLGLFAVTGQSPALPPQWRALLAGAVLIGAAVMVVQGRKAVAVDKVDEVDN